MMTYFFLLKLYGSGFARRCPRKGKVIAVDLNDLRLYFFGDKLGIKNIDPTFS